MVALFNNTFSMAFAQFGKWDAHLVAAVRGRPGRRSAGRCKRDAIGRRVRDVACRNAEAEMPPLVRQLAMPVGK